MPAISRLAARLAGLSVASVDDDVLELARQRMFDVLAGVVCGSAMAEARLLRRVAPGFASTALGICDDRLRYLVGVARSTEIDDIDLRSGATAGAVVIPAALEAWRGTERRDEASLLTAVIAGYEAAIGLGRVVEGARRNGTGVWPTHLVAPIGAAAAAAAVLELDDEKTAHALALATSVSTGAAVSVSGPASPRWLIIGSAACDGVRAARAADLGVIGDLAVVDDTLAKIMREPYDADRIIADGGAWRITSVEAKPFRTARQALAATTGFLEIVGERDRDEIAAVTVGVPSQVLGMVNRPFPLGHTTRLGVQYQIALACIDDTALFDLTETAHDDPDAFARVMERITVEIDGSLSERYPDVWGASVAVRWTGSSSEERVVVLDPPGSPASPLGWEGLADKHRRVLRATLGEGPARPASSERALDVLESACRRLGSGAGSVSAILAVLDSVVAQDAPS